MHPFLGLNLVLSCVFQEVKTSHKFWKWYEESVINTGHLRRIRKWWEVWTFARCKYPICAISFVFVLFVCEFYHHSKDEGRKCVMKLYKGVILWLTHSSRLVWKKSTLNWKEGGRNKLRCCDVSVETKTFSNFLCKYENARKNPFSNFI